MKVATGARVSLAVVALMLGVGAAIVGTPERSVFIALQGDSLHPDVENTVRTVDVWTVAAWLRLDRESVRLVDVRSAEDFDEMHIPGAITRLPDSVSDGETIVLYSLRGGLAAEKWYELRSKGTGKVLVLRGGLEAWADSILSYAAPEPKNAEEWRKFNGRAELSRYFGGVPRFLAAAEIGAARTSGSGVIAARRRGC